MATSTPLAAFRSRDFRLYQLAQLLTTVATQMQGVAVGWQVYALTGRALNLGYVGLVQFLPAVVLSLFTGQVADRFNRRTVLLCCHVLLCACAFGLNALSQRAQVPVVGIYVILTLIGVARAFQGPAGQALMPNLVPIEHFPNAVAWNSSIYMAAVMFGPALGGFVYAAATARGVYLAAGVIELVTLGVLLALRATPSAGRKNKASLAEALAGLRYVLRKPIILGSISLDLFAVLFGGAIALLPVFARDILQVGPRGLGLLRSAPAIGALIVGVVLAYRPLRERAGITMFVCVAVFGLATIVFGLSHSFALSLVALAVTGASDMVSVFVRHTLVQLNTPDSMRGRVSAVNVIFIGASNELGEFESGLTAAWFGTVPAVVIGGVGTCLVVLIWALLFPELRRVDRFETAKADDTEPEPEPRSA